MGGEEGQQQAKNAIISLVATTKGHIQILSTNRNLFSGSSGFYNSEIQVSIEPSHF